MNDENEKLQLYLNQMALIKIRQAVIENQGNDIYRARNR